MNRTLRAALAGIFVAGMAAAPAAFADEKTYKIDEIIITGNKAVSTDALVAKVPFHHGDKVPASMVADGAQAILHSYDSLPTVGAQINATLNPNKARNAYNAVYTLTETAVIPTVTKVAPKLHAIIFDGNQKIDSDALTAALGAKPGDDLSNDKVAAMQKAIVALYATKKINVEISGENKKNDDGTYDVIWHITEKK